MIKCAGIAQNFGKNGLPLLNTIAARFTRAAGRYTITAKTFLKKENPQKEGFTIIMMIFAYT